MSLALNNRLDIVILSTEEKPTVNLKNGSTLYEVDTAKLYVWYEGSWYDEEGNAVIEEGNGPIEERNAVIEETKNTETNDSNRTLKTIETEEQKEEIIEDVVEDDNK